VEQIRRRLTYANVVSSIAVFLVLGGATAFAASHLGKNSVGAKQLKKNAVTTVKIKNNAVTSAKIKNGAVTGAKVNAGTLGTVPSATTAATAGTAANLAGQQNFFVRLNVGQSQTIATNGSVSLVATCENTAGKDIVKILGQTSLPGAIQDGTDDLTGPNGSGEFLEPGTPIEKREFLALSVATGGIFVESQIDQGFVLGPDGKMITLNSEGTALGLNYGGSACLTAGVVNLLG
jgi:hypothetical protein